MTIIDAENLPAADLKARRDELAKALAGQPAAELAARYVQARLDAKLRDERMAEQGATLTALQQGLAAATERAAAAEASLITERRLNESSAAELVRRVTALEESLAGMTADRDDWRLTTATAERRADAAERLAKARRAVLAKLMSDVAPLLAAEE